MINHQDYPLDLLRSRLRGVQRQGKGYMALCPGHADKSPSLSLSLGEDGRALVHCYAGCETRDVLFAIGLELRDLFPENLSENQRQQYQCKKIEHMRKHELLIMEIGRGEGAAGCLSEESSERMAVAAERLDQLERQLPDLGVAAVPQWSALTVVDLDNLMAAEPCPVRFLFDPLLPLRHVTLLGGHGGTGKSSLALVLGAHAACGRPWAGFPVERCSKVVFVSLEDEGALVRYRLRRIIAAYGLDSGVVAKGLLLLDGTEACAALMSEDSGPYQRAAPTSVLSEMRQKVAGADLVIIDNASDAFDANENSRRDVRAFIRELASIAKRNDAAVMLLAHIDKAAAKGGAYGNSYSGSTAWHNSARSRLALVTDDSGGITLLHEKLNLGSKAEPVILSFDSHGVLIPSVNLSGQLAGCEVTSAFDAQEALNVVRAAIEAGITVPAATTGPATAWHALELLPELAGIYRTKNGKKRFKAALVCLLRDGRLIREGYTKPNRHAGERLKLPLELAQTGMLGASEHASECAPCITPIPP